jgi:hypothetical protein
LDYFGARYLSAAQGRFASADNFLNDTAAPDPQSWNLYAYARNNPLRYVDPTGEKIYVGDLSDTDLNTLLTRIDATFGCTGCTSKGVLGYLRVDTSGLNKEMLAATDYLEDAINSTKSFARVEVSNNDSKIAFGNLTIAASGVKWNGLDVNASLIRLDFGDDRWVGGDPVAKQTFLNTVFAHEVAHWFPDFIKDPTSSGSTGPVVDKVNKITDALGEPRRTEYYTGRAGGAWRTLTFSIVTALRNRIPQVKRVQIYWLISKVGGDGGIN